MDQVELNPIRSFVLAHLTFAGVGRQLNGTPRLSNLTAYPIVMVSFVYADLSALTASLRLPTAVSVLHDLML